METNEKIQVKFNQRFVLYFHALFPIKLLLTYGTFQASLNGMPLFSPF